MPTPIDKYALGEFMAKASHDEHNDTLHAGEVYDCEDMDPDEHAAQEVLVRLGLCRWGANMHGVRILKYTDDGVSRYLASKTN